MAATTMERQRDLGPVNMNRHEEVELRPIKEGWLTIAMGAVVPLGMAIAATVSSYVAENDRVAIAAWVSTAIVGTASVIGSAAAARERRRIVDRDREKAGSSVAVNRDSLRD